MVHNNYFNNLCKNINQDVLLSIRREALNPLDHIRFMSNFTLYFVRDTASIYVIEKAQRDWRDWVSESTKIIYKNITADKYINIFSKDKLQLSELIALIPNYELENMKKELTNKYDYIRFITFCTLLVIDIYNKSSDTLNYIVLKSGGESSTWFRKFALPLYEIMKVKSPYVVKS